MALKFGHDQIAIVKDWDHFDPEWYLDTYPDVKLASMDPAYHYLWLGQRLGRRPSALFDDFVDLSLEPSELLYLIQQNLPQSGLGSGPRAAHRSDPDSAAEFIVPGSGTPANLAGLSIAIHAHIFYANLIEEFAAYLSRMPCRFDLYVSTPDETTRAAILASFSKIDKVGRLDVRVVPNRGRDIAPFVVEFGAILAGYDIVAHIQTKKSLYNNGATDGWREYVLDALFPAPDELCHIFEMLGGSRYGMIYPQSFHNLPYFAHTWLANSGLARAWAGKFGVTTLPEGYFDFPAGSMFWARADAIRPLLEAGLQWEDFPPEQGQTDGTLAHCIERMFGVVATSRGHQHGVIADRARPSWSRWRIDQFVDRSIKHPHAMIIDESVKLVAFDIFDTLLLRHFIDPDYVKTMLHARYAAAGIPNFRDIRGRCENDVRTRKGSDVSIHEIYAEMARQEPGYSFDIDAEIALEIESVRPREDVVELLEFVGKVGKRVVLCSDMFLTRDIIETMLRRCGVVGWDKLYLSSEIGLRKDRGEMYEHMLGQEDLVPSQILMIGDNERSDCQIPSDMGFKALHILKPINVVRGMPRLEKIVPDAAEASSGEQFLFGAIAAESYSTLSFTDFSATNMFGASARSIGYGLLGPISLAFSQRLLTGARAANIDRLYFLSREGKFLKAAYDAWSEGLDDKIAGEYLLVSRRAVTVPAISSLNDIYTIADSNNFYGEGLDVFLKERFGVLLDDALWRRIEASGTWTRERALTIMDGDIRDVRPLLDFIAPVIFERAKAERLAALAYFEEMKVSADDRGAVVDVGYGGTIQRHLGKLLNCKVHGLYMMVNSGALAWSRAAGVTLQGFFAGVSADNPLDVTPMFANSFLLEKMLSANDEQLMFYKPNGGFEYRELQDYVAAGQQTRDEMQQGALDFIRDAVRYRETIDPSVSITPERAQGLFNTFVADTSLRERAVLSSLLLDDFYCGRGVIG